MHPAKPASGPPAVISYAALSLGLLILVGNEIRSVVTSTNLTAPSQPIDTIEPSQLDLSRNGQTVHLSGAITASRLATDPRFPVPGEFLLLRRIVEMQQWKKEPTRGRTNLTGVAANGFDLNWSATEIDTRADAAPPAQHNPPMPLKSEAFAAEGLQLGVYSLPPDVLPALGSPTKLAPSRELATALAATLPNAQGVIDRQWIILANAPALPSPRRSGVARAVWPAGTLRVRFEVVPAGVYSLVARQSQSSLMPFDGPLGRPQFIARSGNHPVQEVYRQAISRNAFLTWALRLFGTGLFVAGLLGVLLHRTHVRRYGRQNTGVDWATDDD